MTIVRDRRIPEGVRAAPALSKALNRWQAAAMRLSNLDPVTTELVRLRCAHHHDCKT